MSEQMEMPTPEQIEQMVGDMTPEQMKDMQENMEAMQNEQMENARKQQQEQIEMLVKVVTDFKPMFLEYVPKAIRTESTRNPFKDDAVNARICHAMMGINTELNELNLAVHKDDRPNIVEELGDAVWYLAVAQDEVNFIDAFDISVENITSIFLGADEAYTVDIMDLLKRAMFYGSEFKEEECVKPFTSIFLGVIINSLKLGVDLTEAMDVNLKKLFVRYPEKFESELAELRDLSAERESLEENTSEEK